jgi:pyruvate/2-oxoglutarate dehydrogenase complex dihydrolipoamide dehydrogenase (E3) component
MPRAYIVEDTRGVMKFVIDAETDEILGAALLSVDAQELINTVALAMRHGIKAAELPRRRLHPPHLHRSLQRASPLSSEPTRKEATGVHPSRRRP